MVPGLGEKGYSRNTKQCHVKSQIILADGPEDLNNEETNNCSGSASRTCCFCSELHAILGGDPITTPKCSVGTSQESESLTASGKNEADALNEEQQNGRQVSRGSILTETDVVFNP